jgi:hydroxymethylglutaryl-CoA reductase
MTLHARSVVTAAGTPKDMFDEVLERVIQSGVIKVWKAQEIARDIEQQREAATSRASRRRAALDAMGVGYGKVVILGEHAVVYGRHAIAAPIPLVIRAQIEKCDHGIHLMIPRWGIEYELAANPQERRSFERPAGVILDQLGLSRRAMRIEVFPEVPRGMGLGGSAAMAVAIVRALDLHYRLGLSDAEINALAFESEKVAHGNPSGMDNTLSCYRRPLVFRSGTPPLMEPLNIRTPIPAVIGMSTQEGLTAKTVGRVRTAWQQDPKLYERIFDQVDALVLRGVQAIQDGDLGTLGELMNICHGMLNALQVSTPELERLVSIAREHGALGAKLTGGGGGGSILAICEGDTEPVVSAIRKAGFKALPIALGGDLDAA